MSINRSLVLVVLVASCVSLQGQEGPNPPRRDPLLLNVLTRVVNVAGGVQALAAVHNLTESGEITFYWAKDVKGPVSIRGLGGNHFRMEADLPQGKRIWLVNDGNGSRKEGDKKAVVLPYANATNLGNLTFPIGHVVAALSDLKTEVSLVGIEEQEGRSIYHLRLKGRLGLVGPKTSAGWFIKDVLVDALTFDILAVKDFPYHHRLRPNAPNKQKTSDRQNVSGDAPREIAFADFRMVNGVKVPFSIKTKLEGHSTFSISLKEVTFNTNLNDGDFTK